MLLDVSPTFYLVATHGTGFLAVMAKPVAGEWIEEEFAGLANADVHHVVSLLERAESFDVGLENEQAECESKGIAFTSFPIKDRGLPISVGEFGAHTKNLSQAIENGQNTVVHCRAGIGRSGLVAAGVLLHWGHDVNQAFERVSKARGVRVPDTEEQYQWLERNARELISGNT